MAPTAVSVDISRSPEDIYAYVTDLSRLSEWQGPVLSSRRTDDGPVKVGSSATVIRKVGPRQVNTTVEITELNPPKSWRYRAVSGPVVGTADYKVEPLDGGQRSRVTVALGFEGRGIGKLLAPIFRRQGGRELLRNKEQLKAVLEKDG